MKNKNVTFLYQSLKSMAKRDSTSMRERMFCYLRQEYLILKIINLIYIHFGPITRLCLIWLFSIYNLMRLPKVNGNYDSIAVIFFKNERVAIRKFENKIKIFGSKYRFKFLIPSFKLMCLSYLFAKRRSLLFGLRGFSLILNYCYLHKKGLQINKFYASSEGCPIVYSYLTYAKQQSIPTTFIAHGLCQKYPEKIIYDEIYLMNEREKNRYETKFRKSRVQVLPSTNKIINTRSLEKSIGIIGSNMMNWKYLATHCQILGTKYPTHKIILRRHPNEIIKKKKQINLTETTSDLMECEFIIGGNSSYLEELRQNGKKVFYDAKLDFAPYDAYGLIADKLITEFNCF